ncbi:MAG: DUF3090 family protein, partial [Ktedonobacterales bacterium]
GTASLWLEREQMDALSTAFEQLLSQVSGVVTLRAEAQANPDPVPGAPDDFPVAPDLDFPVGQMQIGYDEDNDRILVRAAPLELIEEEDVLTVREDSEPLFTTIISRSQATRLIAHINAVLAGGRPRCPFCGRPMQGTHVCDKQNGFHPPSLN